MNDSKLQTKTNNDKKMLANTVPAFLRKLFAIYNCDFSSDMDDYQACFEALMNAYAVRFVPDGEAAFYSEINTEAHAKDYDLFALSCQIFMDFSQSTLLSRRTTLMDMAATAGKLREVMISNHAKR